MQKKRKTTLSLCLSVALAFCFSPVAYADNSADEVKQSQNVQSDTASYVEEAESEETATEPDAAETRSAASDEQVKEADGEVALATMSEEGDSGIELLSGSASAAYAVEYSDSLDTGVIECRMPNAVAARNMGASSVLVQATMEYDGVVTSKTTKSFRIQDIIATNGSFEMDCGTYGKFSLQTTVLALDGGAMSRYNSGKPVYVSASEYNIAPVSATFPLTLFSMQLWDITENSAGKEVPTVVFLERPAAYNWDNLPEGVYPLPYLTRAQLTEAQDADEQSNLFRKYSAAMAAYVSDLYIGNPNAEFHLYCVDFYVTMLQSCIYANGIPNSNYDVVLMSDGSFTATSFQAQYSVEDPSAKHAELVDEWNAAKAYAYENGSVKDGYNIGDATGLFWAAVDSEPNISFYVGRKDLLKSTGDHNEFGAAVQANPKVIQASISSMLTALQGKGDGIVSEFKALYNFSDEYFAAAKAAGKKPMVLLGTRVTGEQGFSDYARFVQTYYGDDYMYYYKGHPATPTDLYPEKKAQLAELGIDDVDSAIAAELILFFNPDIYMSGYDSSTFDYFKTSGSSDQASTMFNLSKTAALDVANPNRDRYSCMSSFISPRENGTDAIGSLCPAGDTCYLVEFADDILSTVDYTIAIWNSTESVLSYYKLQSDGSYTLVRNQEGAGASGSSIEPPVQDGVYSLVAKGTDKAIDISGGSLGNGGNVQLYDDNATAAQRFRLSWDGSCYVITNVNSGKVLDVAGAGKTNGTNVQQYESNNTNAQKWYLFETGDGDGSYFITTKDSGMYLDRQGAGTGNGTNLQVYLGNGTDAQKFYLQDTKTVADGAYKLVSGIGHSSFVLDISNASQSDGANAQIFSDNGTAAQRFVVSYDGQTGYYRLKNEASGKSLDAASGGSSSGTNVWQFSENDSAAQRWSIEARDDKFVIRSATGGCVLDVSGAQASNGANVQIYAPNGTDAQKWEFAAA